MKFLLIILIIGFILVTSTKDSKKNIERNLELPKQSLSSFSPFPTPEPTIPGAKYTNTYVTFYGWVDNDPPGKAIAYPSSRYPESLHSEAGGIGTYDDPLTFASDPDEWPIGSKLYIPYIKKYVLMEDWCSVCVEDWRNNKKHHIDVWMESDDGFKDELLQCENHWTRRRIRVEIDPPAGREVSTTPLFNKASGKCLSLGNTLKTIDLDP